MVEFLDVATGRLLFQIPLLNRYFAIGIANLFYSGHFVFLLFDGCLILFKLYQFVIINILVIITISDLAIPITLANIGRF